MKIKFLFSLAVLAFLFNSCTKNDLTPNGEITSDEHNTEPISQEGIEFMESLSVNLEDAELITVEYPDGTAEEVYLIEGDIMIPKEKYERLTSPGGDVELRQWYTGQTVNNWQTIHVLGYNSGSIALSSNMRTAMARAVWNYQNLNMGLNFTYSFGSSVIELNTADIVVYKSGAGAGGSAGFPSGGVPYKWVILQNGLSNASFNVIEHVISHEIAHCIGMRHNDWQNRSSCGQNINEGGSVAHIPGTPLGADYSGNGSLLNACYPSNTDGNFNANDRAMMEYLYPTGITAQNSWTGAGDGARGWHIGDFNGDGKDDIFRYVPGSCGAQVFLSNGASFVYAGCWTGAGDGVRGWHIGDFNGDGKDDIFRYVPGSCGAQVFLSNGSSFAYSSCWTPAGDGSKGWHIGDFNGDGKDDIFRYVPGSCGAEMILSSGSSFAGINCWTPAGVSIKGWHIGDFNGDGKDDIFRYRTGSCGAEMILSSGSSFAGINCWTTASDGDRGWHIGDFNGDGKDDVFRYLSGVSGADVFLSTGNSF